MTRSATALLALALLASCKSKPPPFPNEVVGFHFGSSPDEFLARCKVVGSSSTIDMQRSGLRVLSCNQVEVRPGWRWTVFGAFCEHGTKLCEISYLASSPSADRDFASLAVDLRDSLGHESKSKSVPGDGTRGAKCAQGGSAGITWLWGDGGAPIGHALLMLDCREDPPRVSLMVTQAEATAERRAFGDGGAAQP